MQNKIWGNLIVEQSSNNVKKMDAYSTKFLNALIEGKDLNYIIDIGFELLGNPIFLTDTINKVLAYTKNIEVDDPDWHEIVEKGYVSYNIATHKKVKEIMERVSISGTPEISKPEGKNISIIRTVIRSENKIIGHLIVPGNFKPFSEQDIDSAALLSNILSLAMQKRRYASDTKGIMAEYFIADLLDGKIKSPSIIKEETKFLKLELKDYLYMLVIRAKDHYNENVSPIKIMESIKKLFSGSVSALYHDDIVLFINSNRKIDQFEMELQDLMKLLVDSKLHGGLSRCFYSLLDIQDYYNQAVQAIELGYLMDKQKVLYLYDNYVLYHMMKTCAKNTHIKTFCHPSLFTLEKYDVKNGTDLMKSLYHYLMNSKNLIETANVLHIHRNTMSYRLKKIEEIMDIDMNDADLPFYLLLSFKILEFIRTQEMD